MSYHTKTFRLLGNVPNGDPSAIAEIQQTEARIGFRLPASVREWYSYADACLILEKYSNQDPPIPLSKFSLIEWQSRRLLPFRYENQGVCIWAIMLDGTEDPPVYVDVDSAGSAWNELATSFSEYVYSAVWDYKLVFGQPAIVQAQNGELTSQAIDQLAAAFNSEIKTFGWPGSVQYRFQREQQNILIWSGEGQADWWVSAASERSLDHALRTIWRIDNVGDSLWDSSDSQIGKKLLNRIRSSS